MTPILFIPTLAPRSLSRFAVAMLVLGAMVLGTSSADAALTTDKCLFLKRQTWGNLRKCEATEQGKLIKAKPADLAKCQTKFQEKLAAITAKATAAMIPCRYRDSGDLTVTDYDTGLQWEQKYEGGLCFLQNVINHCVTITYTWDEAQSFVISSTDSTTAPSFLAGYADWRLPRIAELGTIVDATVPGGCSFLTNPCIDPIFGPTVPGVYWSATTYATVPTSAWLVSFGGGYGFSPKNSKVYVRAVRTAL